MARHTDPAADSDASLASRTVTANGTSTAFANAPDPDREFVDATLAVSGASGGTYEHASLDTPGASAGTFTLTLDGHTTAPIAYNAAASVVQAALRALPGVGTDVVCGAGPLAAGTPTPVTIVFSGALIGPRVLTADSTGLTGGAAAVTVSTPGVAPTLTLALQGSDDGADWVALGTFPAQAAVVAPGPEQTFDVAGHKQLRWSWTVAGASPSFTFAVAASSKTLSQA